MAANVDGWSRDARAISGKLLCEDSLNLLADGLEG